MTTGCIYQLPFSKCTPGNKEQNILADGRTVALVFTENAPSLFIFLTALCNFSVERNLPSSIAGSFSLQCRID